MARKTIYLTQTFWRSGKRLEPGQQRQHLNEDRAREEGRRIAKAASGVVVFSVDGYPDEDYWEDPVVLETIGAVPVSANQSGFA